MLCIENIILHYQVIKLDLQHNDLIAIPRCILELPALQDLNLSHNKLTEIPEVAEGSLNLTVFDLSYNLLSSLPQCMNAPAIRSLNIGHNRFRQVPTSICSLVTLYTLDLSENPDILTLPAEMGKLNALTRLDLRGIKDLNDPPKNVQKECTDCIRYLNSKLRSATGFFHIKMMVVGLANKGKTTLVCRLQGRDVGPNTATNGVNVSEWVYRHQLRKTFHFSIWDFGGQEEYYSIHRCFLSQNSLYLLLFSLKDGEKGVQELKPWLNNIALHAPHSLVIVVGTHLDEFSDEERGEVDVLVHKVDQLSQGFRNKLQIKAVVTVGLMRRLENIGQLKETIYEHVANYRSKKGEKIMGRMVPASYHVLEKHINVIQQEVRNGHREPIMHAEEFKTMLQKMELTDVCNDEEEIKIVSVFLTDVGTLLHYDDKGHNLHELYFIDPRWLCDMMSKVITIPEKNPFVKDGILPCKAILQLLKDDTFPWRYFEQFLTLLDRFEIALPLDNKRILIPSMLPKERPSILGTDQGSQRQEYPLYSREIIFNSADTPPGFWSRLLSRLMHSVPQVCFALDKTTPQNPDDPSEPSLDSPSPVDPLDNSINPGTSFEDPQIEISQPTSLSNLPQPIVQSAQLLRNFPDPLPALGIAHMFDSSQIQLIFWRTGLFYSDSEVMFQIECLSGSGQCHDDSKDGVLIVTSPTGLGKKIMGQLVDLVLSLINEWYPGIQEGVGPSTGLEQKVPCYECLKLGRTDPFKFRINDCMDIIENNQTQIIKCGYDHENPAMNHLACLADIVPDLLLQDIDQQFLLKMEDLTFSEEPASLLGEGAFGKVYRGKYRIQGRSQEVPVAVKTYTTKTNFTYLRSETKFLQKSHHPCLVRLVGVCIHPMMALVLEEAPMGSLQKHLIKYNIPIHRLVIHRMAAQVAAALHFLHSTGIIFRDVKASNVLLWSLSPDSLCHCKLTDFGIATHLAPVGAKGLQGTKGFIAPEVFYIGKRKQRCIYDHNADIYSFSMFLYQMIARRHPFHDMKPHRIDNAVELGCRPKLQDVSLAETAFHFLTRLMKCCWEDNIDKRPSTEEIIKSLCLSSVQSIMSVLPVKSPFSIRHACTITVEAFTRARAPHINSSELWVCCDGLEGTELNIFNTNTMTKIHKCFIKDYQVQCIGLCGDHVWMGTRAGIGPDALEIFSIHSRDIVHSFQMNINEGAVSCITCTDSEVYLGTTKGYCLSFSLKIKEIRDGIRPKCKNISEHAIDGILAIDETIWASHTHNIQFLDTGTMRVDREGLRHRKGALVGKLSLSADGDTVWSAHFRSTILTAWDAHRKVGRFDVDVAKHMKNVSPASSDHDMFITAITPALDTVWVGIATGHILIFHDEELMQWYHCYSDYIPFLSCIPCSGPTTTESCMVASGGKKTTSRAISNTEDYNPIDDPGVLVLWEAYDAKTTQQIKLVEDNAPWFFSNNHTMRKMIQRGEFVDGTNLFHRQGKREVDSSQHFRHQDHQPVLESIKVETVPVQEPTQLIYDSLRHSSADVSQSSLDDSDIGGQCHTWTRRTFQRLSESEFSTDSEQSLESLHESTTDIPHETFDVRLPGPEDSTTVTVTCQIPVKLEDLLSELQMSMNFHKEQTCIIEYQHHGSGPVPIHTQEQLEAYLELKDKPQLFLNFFKSHHSMKRMIQRGEFDDGTNLFHRREIDSSQETYYSKHQDNQQGSSSSEGARLQEPRSLVHDSLRHDTIMLTQRRDQENPEGGSPTIPDDLPSMEQIHVQSPVHSIPYETASFEIRLLGPEDSTSMRVTCPKPVTLKVLLSKLQEDVDIPEEQCMIEYRQSDSGECVPVYTQEQLEVYLQLENTPQLCLSSLPLP